jgi:hypothetical protein
MKEKHTHLEKRRDGSNAALHAGVERVEGCLDGLLVGLCLGMLAGRARWRRVADATVACLLLWRATAKELLLGRLPTAVGGGDEFVEVLDACRNVILDVVISEALAL